MERKELFCLAEILEIKILKMEYEDKISRGIIKMQPDGSYKIGRKFEDLNKKIYVRAYSAEDAAVKLYTRHRDELHGLVKHRECGVLFKEVAEEWFVTNVLNMKKSRGTIVNTRGELNNHILPTLGDKGIKTIKMHDLQSLLNEKGETLGADILRRIKNNINNIFEFAIDNDYLEKNPARHIKLPNCQVNKVKSKEPVTNDEFVLALKAAKANGDLQMILILCMLYVYGLRTIELVNIKWDDLFLDERVGYIHISTSKYTNTYNMTIAQRENTKRDLPLSPIIRSLLLEQRAYQETNGIYNGTIFHRRQSSKALTSDFVDDYFLTLTNQMEIVNGAKVFNNKIVEYTGVRHFVPYAFRKRVVTELNGMNYNDAITQKFVGHTPKEVKDKNYSHLNFENHLRQAFAPYMDKAENELSALLKRAEVTLE